MSSDRRKDFTDERKEFLQWLCDEDVNMDSPIECILNVEEHEFLRNMLESPYYYLDERARIKKIIDKYKDEIMPVWNEYFDTKE